MTPESNMQSTSPAPTSGGGEGPFSEEDINQICEETGYDREKVIEDIEKTGAQTKEELYPAFYSGQGVQPMQDQGETVSPGAVQGQHQGAPEDMQQAPPPEGAPMEEQQEMAPDADDQAAGGTPGGGQQPPQGIDPATAAAIHQALAPPLPAAKAKPKGRPEYYNKMQGS